MPLTDKGLRSIRPTDKDQFVADGDRLYVRIRSSGSKTFVVRSQANGKSRWLTVGHYPEMSLAEARKEAARKLDAAALSPITFGEVWAEYERHIVRTLRRPQNYQTTARVHLLPRLGKRPMRVITRSEVAKVVQDVLDTGKPSAATYALIVARLVFKFAEARGWIDDHVLRHLDQGAFVATPRGRNRHLDPGEVRAFYERLGGSKRHSAATKLASGLLLLTGQRRSEVLGMNVLEVTGRWWTIAAPRTKPLRAQKVYLSPQAAALWRIAVRELGPAPFKRVHPDIFSQSVSRLAAKMVADGQVEQRFTAHDFRRTMATRLSDHGVAPHVIEKMLNHQMTGVMAVYNHAEYLPERRAAWRLWGALVNQWRKNRPPVSSQRAEPSLGEGRRER